VRASFVPASIVTEDSSTEIASTHASIGAPNPLDTDSEPRSLATKPRARSSPVQNTILRDLLEIAGDFARYHELLTELTTRDLRIRYKQAVMGVAWAVLTPLVVVLAGWVVRVAFSYLSGAPVARAELAGVALKSVGWSFFVGALGFSTASIPANIALVTKVYFPRELLPVSALLTQMVDTAVGAAALLVLLPFFGVRLTPALLWVVPLVVLLVLVTLAISLIASCANVFFRDARHLVQLVISFGIFFTPVFFDAASVGPRGARLLMLNPLAPILEGLRFAVVDGHNLATPLVSASGTTLWSPWTLAYAAVCAIVGAAASAIVFHRAEFKFAEYV
jgi:lipopolysaccharide transport system permease protein